MKKIVALLLAAVLCSSVLFMTACGEDNKKSDDSGTSSVNGQDDNSETKNPFEISNDTEESKQESQADISEISTDESKVEESQIEEQSVQSMPEEESEPEDSDDIEDSEDDEDSDSEEDSEDDEDSDYEEDSEYEEKESLPDGEVNEEYAGTWKSSYDFSALDASEAAIIKGLVDDINVEIVLSTDGSALITISSYDDEPDDTATGSWNANGKNVYLEIDGSVESFVYTDGKLVSEALPYMIFTRS